MDFAGHSDQLIWTIVYAVLGIVLLGGAFLGIATVAPFSIRKEIEEDHNTSLAVLIAGFLVALGLIIAAAIAG